MIKKLILGAVAFATVLFSSCEQEQLRIPPHPVRIPFITVGDWNLYGVSGALDYRYFTLDPRQPAGYTYPVYAATGFGGVLLVGDVLGTPRAYDLACPVEAQPNVRIQVDSKKSIAVCPKCGSSFAVFELGNAIDGPAAQNGWALRQYTVSITKNPIEYACIIN